MTGEIDVAALVATARRWRDADPDPATRAAMDAVIARRDPAELARTIGTPLRFGTAGLRAALGPGPARMNRAVVRRTAAALAQHLLDGAAATPLVVVGHDARHGSATFGSDIVEVLVAHGVDVARFDEPVPTPLVATALCDLGASAAVVVTASHNPASDNGLKVYAADGAQIVPPADDDIAARLEAMAPDHDPLAAPSGTQPGRSTSLGGPAGDHPVVLAYLARATSPCAGRPPGALVVAHSSLHGVGDVLLRRAFDALPDVRAHAVAVQQAPDPDFPTVASPNPEEPGTLDLLLELAAARSADVAFALDPDADRLAVALPLAAPEAAADGPAEPAWRVLSGDEVGALLAHDLLAADRRRAPAEHHDALVVTTIVSSRLVPAMCAAAGVHHAETLTGFKWLCRPALAHPRWHQLLAYEEALGYAVGRDRRDKDGITAAVAVLAALGELRRRGRTAWDVLDELALRHGAHVTDNGSLPVPHVDGGPTDRAAVDAVLDSLAGRTRLGDRDVDAADRPAADVVRLSLVDGTRVLVRPSGTEPKVKYYVEAIEPVGASSVETARRIAAERAAATAAALAAAVDAAMRTAAPGPHD